MIYPDANLGRPGSPPEPPAEPVQDIVPPTERNQDPHTDIEHMLERGESRPLSAAERKAADHDSPVGERVYAPASERVPVEPVPGHRDVVEHTDTHTPEREAAGATEPAVPSPRAVGAGAGEPSFTRVPRPSGGDTPTPGAYASPMSNPAWDRPRDWAAADQRADRERDRRRRLFVGLGASWLTALGVGVGLWLFVRWRRERNKPINRLRRRAAQAASQLRERVPSPDEAAKPAMGATTALLSILLLLWQQGQARSRNGSQTVRGRAANASRKAEAAVSEAAAGVSDADWQKRLLKLKERWNPSRVELEKISISRHR